MWETLIAKFYSNLVALEVAYEPRIDVIFPEPLGHLGALPMVSVNYHLESIINNDGDLVPFKTLNKSYHCECSIAISI